MLFEAIKINIKLIKEMNTIRNLEKYNIFQKLDYFLIS